MRRLSIIDLGTGWQPIYNEDRSITICYNGEAYNYVELCMEFRGKKHLHHAKRYRDNLPETLRARIAASDDGSVAGGARAPL